MAEHSFIVGDRVRYKSEAKAMQGIGTVIDIFPIEGEYFYRVQWDSDTPLGVEVPHSTELAEYLARVNEPASITLTKDMAEDIATYLSLDSVENSQVSEWMEALRRFRG